MQDIGKQLLAAAASSALAETALQEVCSLLLDILFMPQSQPLHRQLLSFLARLPEQALNAIQHLSADKVRIVHAASTLSMLPFNCSSSTTCAAQQGSNGR